MEKRALPEKTIPLATRSVQTTAVPLPDNFPYYTCCRRSLARGKLHNLSRDFLTKFRLRSISGRNRAAPFEAALFQMEKIEEKRYVKGQMPYHWL